jgi:hypothetical protein
MVTPSIVLKPVYQTHSASAPNSGDQESPVGTRPKGAKRHADLGDLSASLLQVLAHETRTCYSIGDHVAEKLVPDAILEPSECSTIAQSSGDLFAFQP